MRRAGAAAAAAAAQRCCSAAAPSPSSGSGRGGSRTCLPADVHTASPRPSCAPPNRVLDLGSGSGRDCYVAAAFVGEGGAVTGLDMTPAQLAVARKHADEYCTQVGVAWWACRKLGGRLLQEWASIVEGLDEYCTKASGLEARLEASGLEEPERAGDRPGMEAPVGA